MNMENPHTVLIVDDNATNLHVLADILRKSGYRVATSKSGEKALNFLLKRKPDLVLLDIMMPEMDGYEVCERIKSDKETADIPVIFISALTEKTNIIKGFETGGVDYIVKPFHREEVNARVSAHLRLKRATEELTEANARLQKANSVKDKLFSIIAHDLRGPVGSLCNILEIITEDSGSLEKEVRDELFGNLNISVKGVYYLLENLLYWAGNQRGHLLYSPAFSDLNTILKPNLMLFAGFAADKGIELTSSIPQDTAVYADAEMVNIVLRNFIYNALKFTPKGGKVSISAEVTEDHAEVRVEDTGVGIPEADQAELFSMDRRFTTRGTRMEKGSGLGLWLCKEFVEKNRGELRVKSREGEGSVFSFTLPVGPEEEENAGNGK